MTECISQLRLGFHPTVPVTVGFDAPQISSDGGVLLLRQTDDRLGLSEWFARFVPDERDPAKVKHERREQVRQRLYQIALGYEDCNDADRLRHDPLLKSVCDRTPTDAGSSSQPTLSRLENAIEGRTLRAILQRLEEHYLQSVVYLYRTDNSGARKSGKIVPFGCMRGQGNGTDPFFYELVWLGLLWLCLILFDVLSPCDRAATGQPTSKPAKA